MMGINNGEGGTGILNFSSVLEFRGNSYGIGGDTGAVTLANFIKNYNPNVHGASTLSHLASLCYGPLCIPPLSLCSFIFIESCHIFNTCTRSTLKR